ncbi:MAG: hypothetical protein ACE5F7_01510 [Nitrospiria bacterium]
MIEKVDEVVEGVKVRIAGSGFRERHPESFVQFEFKTQRLKAGILSWKENEIVVLGPVFPAEYEGGEIKVTVSAGPAAGQMSSVTVPFKVFSNKLTSEIINLKEEGFSDRFIMNQYDKKISEMGVRDTTLDAFDILKLDEAHLSEDLISNIARHRQYLTIGISGIWLHDTRDLVTSPMIRIFISPRSYFEPRKPFWSKGWDFGPFNLKRYDLNVGYTTKTSTDSGTEKKSYLLLGLSFELNRAALLNVGMAFVPGDIAGDQTQPYVGITMDSNLLKDIGILDKG